MMKKTIFCYICLGILPLLFLATSAYTQPQQKGYLRVYIDPPAAQTAGARWKADNLEWKEDQNLIELTPGQHTINFKDVDGWIKPDFRNITISAGQSMDLRVRYTQRTGSIRVTITTQPPGAVPAGARWSLGAGMESKVSGATVDVSPGPQRITFSNLNGWNKPQDQTINVTAGQISQAEGTYQQTTGSLRIMIEPVLPGAQWRILLPGQGWQGWQNRGDTVSGLLPGTVYEVEFKIVDGWTKPANMRVPVNPNQTETVIGRYTNPIGFLQVDITPPEAAGAGIKWKVGNSPWQNSGARLQLPADAPGSYNVDFAKLPDWILLTPVSANIRAGETVNATANFAKANGTLTVTLVPPEAIRAGAMWILSATGVRHNSGQVVTVPAGDHRIEFTEVPGWAKPQGDTWVNVAPGKNTTLEKRYLKRR
jgi:hypothetical protein